MRKSREYSQYGCVVRLDEEFPEQLFAGEWIKVFCVKCLFQGTMFLAEVRDIYAEAAVKEEAIKAIKRKLFR